MVSNYVQDSLDIGRAPRILWLLVLKKAIWIPQWHVKYYYYHYYCCCCYYSISAFLLFQVNSLTQMNNLVFWVVFLKCLYIYFSIFFYAYVCLQTQYEPNAAVKEQFWRGRALILFVAASLCTCWATALTPGLCLCLTDFRERANGFKFTAASTWLINWLQFTNIQ